MPDIKYCCGDPAENPELRSIRVAKQFYCDKLLEGSHCEYSGRSPCIGDGIEPCAESEGPCISGGAVFPGTIGYELGEEFFNLPFSNHPGSITIQIHVNVGTCSSVIEGSGNRPPGPNDRIHARFGFGVDSLCVPDGYTGLILATGSGGMFPGYDYLPNTAEIYGEFGGLAVDASGTFVFSLRHELQPDGVTPRPFNPGAWAFKIAGFLCVEDATTGDPVEVALTSGGGYGLEIDVDVQVACCDPAFRLIDVRDVDTLL